MAGYDSFRVDVSGSDTLLKRLTAMPGKMARAIQLALNTIGRSTRTQSWRAIRDEINLKPSYIRNEVNFIPATLEELRVIIFARRRGVTLSQFPHKQLWRKGQNGKQVKAGVKVSVGKGWTELVEGAFIAPIGPAGGLIVERLGKPRLPLEVLHGPSPSQVMETKLDELRDDARRRLVPEVERQLKRVDL